MREPAFELLISGTTLPHGPPRNLRSSRADSVRRPMNPKARSVTLTSLRGDGSAFAFVAIQGLRLDPALRYVGQQHGQVVSVLQAGIHALPTDWGVHVGGIPGWKDGPHRKLGRDAMVDPVRGEPIHCTVFQTKLGVKGRKRLVLGDLVLGGQGHEPGVAAGSQGKQNRE